MKIELNTLYLSTSNNENLNYTPEGKRDASKCTYFSQLQTSEDINVIRTWIEKTDHSTIQWKSGKRLQENFEYAKAIMMDFDKDVKVEFVEKILRDANLNFVIANSKSHTSEAHRFHVYIPTQEIVTSAKDYALIYAQIRDTYFIKEKGAATSYYADNTSQDGARFYFASGSPLQIFITKFDGNNFNYDFPDELVEENDETVTINFAALKQGEALGVIKKSKYEWSEITHPTITLGDGSVAQTKDLLDKTKHICFCPYCIHDSTHRGNPNTANAFLDYSPTSSNFYIACSSCSKTYWHVEDSNILYKKYEKFFWSRGDVWAAELTAENKLDWSYCRKETLLRQTGLRIAPKEKQEEVFDWLAKEKYIPSISKVEYVADVNTDKAYIEMEPNKPIVIHIPPAPVIDQDNDLINTYLTQVFGKYTDFIKQYMAVYTYTNYLPLPYIILRGERSCGKSTFYNLMSYLFPNTSIRIKNISDSFNDHVEFKLVNIDESTRKGGEQYDDLKDLRGSETHTVNKKFERRFQIRNNVNVIITSNKLLPITVAKDELPTDERINQFFAYEVANLDPAKVDHDLNNKLKRAVGHYLRTELKTIFDNLTLSGRYSISVPITDYEKKLFGMSDNIQESMVGMIEEHIYKMFAPTGIYEKDDYDYKATTIHGFLVKGYLPKTYLSKIIKNNKVSLMVEELIKNNIIISSDESRIKLNGEQLRCYKLTESYLNELKNDVEVI